MRENSASQRMDLQYYKFFFNSVTDNSEKYILLDVAFCLRPEKQQIFYQIIFDFV